MLQWFQKRSAHSGREVDRAVHPADMMFVGYRKLGSPQQYFRSGASDAEFLSGIFRRHGEVPRLRAPSIGDYGCHYGRVMRHLAGCFPGARITAYDVDRSAVEYCAAQFGAKPVHVDWLEGKLPDANARHDLLICLSVLTHTDRAFAERAVGFWARLVRRGGLIAFTYLGPGMLDMWVGGTRLDHYGRVPQEQKIRVADSFAQCGHAFVGFPSRMSERLQFGIGFLGDTEVRRLTEQAGFRIVESIGHERSPFAQDTIVARRLRS